MSATPAPDGSSHVRRLLVALVSLVCRYPTAVLVVAAALCAASGWSSATRLRYHTQRNDLLSAHKDCQRRWNAYLAEFGDDDDVVAVVKGEDRARQRKALDGLAERFAARPDLFDRLFHRVDLRPLRDRALLYLPTEQVSAIHREHLGEMRRLLDAGLVGWHALGLHSLTREAMSRAAELRPGETVPPADARFFAQYQAVTREARASLTDPAAYRSPWAEQAAAPAGRKDLMAEPQYFFSEDGALGFLLVRPVKEAGSFTAALGSVKAAREILAEVQAEFSDLEMGLTGMPVLETDEMVAAERDTRLASWLAVAGVSVLFLAVYRSVAYPVLTVLTLLVGTCWAMGWLTLTVGHLNILSATFAVMLIGMGDYGVLWVMRYEQARREGLAVREALLHTTVHVAIGNLTAASTLALAFFAAILADFKAVAELGWIAGCGVLLCAFACFTVLPALLMRFDRRGVLAAGPRLFDPEAPAPTPVKSGAAVPAGGAWLPWLGRHPGLVLAAALVVVAGAGACATRVGYDHNLLHLQAQGLDSVKWEMTLLEHTTGASWHALSIADTPEQAAELAERYRQVPEVSQVIEVSALVPTGQAEKLPLLEDIHKALTRLPRRHAPLPHLSTDVTALRADLAALVSRLGGQPELEGLLRELRALNTRLAQTLPAEGGERLRLFDQRLAEDLAENMHRLRAVSRPAAIAVRDLPANLRERYVGQTGRWLVRVFAREGLWDFGPLERFNAAVRAVDPEATGKPFGTAEGLAAMKGGLERAGIYAFVVIVFVLWIDFRSPRDTLLAVVPLLLGVLLTLGVLGLLGMPLNPANMIAFPLILGVGVDNGVHVLHDWLIRRREGKEGVSAAIGRGVLIKALTTMIGFGTLMIATERGLAGLGFILTVGVGCSMLSALLLLPALLQVVGRREPAAKEVAEEVRQAA